MADILFLRPVFKEMIWGGNQMRESFGYEIPGDHTGEAWIVSAHPQGDCEILNGIERGREATEGSAQNSTQKGTEGDIQDGAGGCDQNCTEGDAQDGAYAGETLGSLWNSHRELFGGLSGDVFPLLVKIIDAKADLSIQVHPDDAYAKEHENGALGKTECWYILDCEKDASIIVGHNASSKEELKQMIQDKEWDQLIKTRPIKPGDFFQIDPGTVHAIKGGTLLIETQQNSAVTYRLYDYDRLSDGKPRELHIEKSIDVIRCPYEEKAVSGQTARHDGYSERQLVTCQYYTVNLYEITKKMEIQQEYPFLIVNVIDGEGIADGHPIKKGDNFILPYQYGICHIESVSGNLRIITSHV